MRILWFANTPCGASEQLSPDMQGGGWLSALEKQLVFFGEVELHVCFHWDIDVNPFSIGGVTYHPIRRLRMKYMLLEQFLGRRFWQDPMNLYLKVISRVKPDLIHVHGTEEGFGLIQSFTELPVVVSIQGILSSCIYKFFSGVSPFRFFLNEVFISHLKLKSALANYYIFNANANRERKILSMTRHIIGRTSWDRRTTAVLAPNAQYHHGDEILRNPFYEAAWSKQKFSFPLRIVTVSGAAPYKGFETVLQVSRILKEQVGLNFIWTVVGLSKKDSVVNVVCKWLGEQAEVKLIGGQSGSALCNILLDSDIFCQVSHIENSPNSLCEAMLIGMPIIATFAGGTDSILCAGEEGVLVQDGDPLSMAGAILKLSQDYEYAVKIGGAARVRAIRRHNPERIVGDLLATYKYILGRKLNA